MSYSVGARDSPNGSYGICRFICLIARVGGMLCSFADAVLQYLVFYWLELSVKTIHC